MEQFTISIYTENMIGLLHRVTTIFTRRHINIESITASESEVSGIHRYTVVITEEEVNVKNVVKQIEKQIEIFKAFYHRNEDIVYQEMALYKMPTNILSQTREVEQIVRKHHARLLAVEPEFTIIEKTGFKEETQDLFEQLKPHGILEFVRSGRISISKRMKEFQDYYSEVEKASRL
ncbi:acetolactate synthase small subunit [Marivirga sp. S37H4]|uniref:Acetolactate synthase small subunit n=1 Tax=Marivirga aurantiaca TaxID=2802615 RepID=A0A935CAY5_9BACT|nr:acetolactate synthase small subunit [Marivirga aurantiaca]MBK6266472.1 acetolactate synthase small subunit [Marivirga aurantiaca]